MPAPTSRRPNLHQPVDRRALRAQSPAAPAVAKKASAPTKPAAPKKATAAKKPAAPKAPAAQQPVETPAAPKVKNTTTFSPRVEVNPFGPMQSFWKLWGIG